MDEVRALIIETLDATGLSYDGTGLKRHASQGLVNDVYTIPSEQGELIVHYSTLTPTLEHFHIWEKLKPVSDFLQRIPDVPAARVFATRKRDDAWVAVQEKLPGSPAGRAIVGADVVSFEWHAPFETCQEQVEMIAARVHNTPIRGFGYPRLDEGTLRGSHDSWTNFLAAEAPLWARGISAGDAECGILSGTLEEDVQRFLAHTLPRMEHIPRTSLVSSDMMNPSNILFENGVVTGVVDWEWALIGDPAWEFCALNPYSLDHYFKYFPELMTKEARRDFLERAALYENFAYLMWGYAVSGNPATPLARAASKRAHKKLTEFCVERSQ